MKTTTTNRPFATSLPSTKTWKDRFTNLAPHLMFNGRAVRARAGILNLIIGLTIVFTVARPDLNVSLFASSLLLIDMILAVALGLTPLSPTGVIGTALTAGFAATPTPHLPKRFAWSMGAMLAATCLTLTLLKVNDSWLVGVYSLFFLLTWLDSTLGFCVGCWIYGKLFGCQSCQVR